MNLSLFRKAYMLEFLENDVPKEVFTFAVAPESEDFDYSQRITETKTFGGSAFDDYGNDTIKITLSGTTINQEKKMIYKGLTKPPKFLTGEQEIYHLQELIHDYGKTEKLAKKKVYLYDLSKMSLIQLLANAGGGAPTKNYWRVAIKSLKIKRAKDKPRTHCYTLEMTGFLDEKNTANSLFGGGFNDAINAIQNVLDTIEMVMGYVEFASAAIDSVAKATVNVKKEIERLQKVDWSDPATAIKASAGLLDSTLRIFSIDSQSSVFNSAKNLISAVNKFASLGASPEEAQSASSANDERTVSFNSGAGSYVRPVKVEFGGLLEEPTAPTYAKHAFSGWYTDRNYTEEFDFETEISENITLYAKWTQTLATVTFNSRLGSAVTAQSVTIGNAAIVPDPAPIRTGFVFEYWCTDIAVENQFNFTTLITGDITLYAKWRTIYAVTFQSNGGSAVPAQQIEVGGKVIAPLIPERENYLLVCWCTDIALNNEYNFNSIVNGNRTLYAKWTQVANSVIFQSNGGSAVPTQTIDIGEHAEKPDNPTRDGYTFIRWCSDAALTNEFFFDTAQINSPVTLYALWNINVYAVIFQSNGGSAVPAQNVQYMNKAVYPVNPTRNEYLFKRWCTDIELTAEFDFSSDITSTLTLYADWYGG